jgi:carbon monoxide dehydrogenase subunit G
MELEHAFSVPVPVERAWEVLLDVERVAPCMPGATLDSVDGDNISGRIKVKVGPIQMTYAGTAKITERDKAAGVVTLEASGKETRGAGTASASVRSELKPDGDQTNVVVHTSLNVTGKPAQFGRGVLAEVGGRLVGIFADNLASMLAAEPPAAAAGADENGAAANSTISAADGTGPATTGAAAEEALPIDVLNLSSRAWSSLRQDGIQTLGDLTRRTEQQLRAIENIGRASLADIRAKLAAASTPERTRTWPRSPRCARPGTSHLPPPRPLSPVSSHPSPNSRPGSPRTTRPSTCSAWRACPYSSAQSPPPPP